MSDSYLQASAYLSELADRYDPQAEGSRFRIKTDNKTALRPNAAEWEYIPEELARRFQTAIQLSDDPEGMEHRLMGAWYLSRLDGSSFEDAFANHETAMSAWRDRALAPREWHEAVAATYQASVTSTEIAKRAYKLWQAAAAGEDIYENPLYQEILALERNMPAPDIQKRMLPTKALKAVAQFLPSFTESAGAGALWGGAVSGAATGIAAGTGVSGALAAGTGLATMNPIGAAAIPTIALLAFGIGQATGSGLKALELETGSTFYDLMRYTDPNTGARINPQAAVLWSGLYGGMASLVEMMQMDTFFKAFPSMGDAAKKALTKAAKDSLSDTTAAAARSGVMQRALASFAGSQASSLGKRVQDIAGETLAEVLQEALNIGAEEFAREMTSRVDGSVMTPLQKEQVVARLSETLVQSALGFGTMSMIPAGMALFLDAGTETAKATKTANAYRAENTPASVAPDAMTLYTKRAAEPIPSGTVILPVEEIEGEQYVMRATDAKGNDAGQVRYTIDQDTQTVAIKGIGKGAPNINAGMIRAITQRFPGWNIEWNPTAPLHVALKEYLTETNPRGRDAGIQDTLPPSDIPQQVTLEYAKARWQEAHPALGDEELTRIAQFATGLNNMRNKHRAEKISVDQFLDDILAPEVVSDQIIPQSMLAQGVTGGTIDVRVGNAIKGLMQLGPNANASTVMHELVHCATLTALADSTPEGRAFRAELEQALGVQNGDWNAEFDGWTSEYKGSNRSAMEALAYAMEDYFTFGRLPRPELKSVFEQIAQWVKDVYRALKGARVTLRPELEKWFDEAFGGADSPFLDGEAKLEATESDIVDVAATASDEIPLWQNGPVAQARGDRAALQRAKQLDDPEPQTGWRRTKNGWEQTRPARPIHETKAGATAQESARDIANAPADPGAGMTLIQAKGYHVEDLPILYQGEEYRSRQALVEMTPDELVSYVESLHDKILLHPLTGIPSRAAYARDVVNGPMRYQCALDADSLKWVNDNMGHEQGNQLLQAIATAINDAANANNTKAYHISGDEYILQSDSLDKLFDTLDQADSILAEFEIKYEYEDDKARVYYTGAKVSYGIDDGGRLDNADRRCTEEKLIRERERERAPRGEPPYNLKVFQDGIGDCNRAQIVAYFDARREREKARTNQGHDPADDFHPLAVRALREERRKRRAAGLAGPLFQNAPRYAYRSEETIISKMRQAMPGRQTLALLRGAGVSADELRWLGLDEWLASNDRHTRDEVLGYIQRNKLQIQEKKPTPKYNEYVTPGGRNYQEYLFILPGGKYRSSHWEESGVLAHTRIQEHRTLDGPVFLIEELQSDWHQQGREIGYASNPDPSLQNLINEYSEMKTEYEQAGRTPPIALIRQLEILNQQIVPDAPLSKTWHEFLFRRMVLEAALNGHETVAWTTGTQQADRYSLASDIETVGYYRDHAGFQVSVMDKNGQHTHSFEDASIDDIERELGKTVAQRIERNEGRVDGKFRYLEGLGLRIGDKGMIEFYDRKLVSYANKLGKPWGAAVVATVLENGQQVHALPITDAMVAGLGDRLPLFQGDDMARREDAIEYVTGRVEDYGYKYKVALSRHSASVYVNIDHQGTTYQIRITDHPQKHRALATYGASDHEVIFTKDINKEALDQFLANPQKRKTYYDGGAHTFERGNIIDTDILFQHENLKHGSPHGFSAFSHHHMGRGEGQQVYGWGTYLTENHSVAKQMYADRLGSRSAIVDGTGKKIILPDAILDSVKRAITAAGPEFPMTGAEHKARLAEIIDTAFDAAMETAQYEDAINGSSDRTDVLERLKAQNTGDWEFEGGRYIYTVAVDTIGKPREEIPPGPAWDQPPSDEMIEKLTKEYKSRIGWTREQYEENLGAGDLYDYWKAELGEDADISIVMGGFVENLKEDVLQDVGLPNTGAGMYKYLKDHMCNTDELALRRILDRAGITDLYPGEKGPGESMSTKMLARGECSLGCSHTGALNADDIAEFASDITEEEITPKTVSAVLEMVYKSLEATNVPPIPRASIEIWMADSEHSWETMPSDVKAHSAALTEATNQILQALIETPATKAAAAAVDMWLQGPEGEPVLFLIPNENTPTAEPSSGRYIRWDKPVPRSDMSMLSEYLDGIANALDSTDDGVLDAAFEPFGDLSDDPYFVETITEAIETLKTETQKPHTGDSLYTKATAALASQKAASLLLHAAGFDGIKYPVAYLTGGSGNSGYNYVIFDDNAMRISSRVLYQAEQSGTRLYQGNGGDEPAIAALKAIAREMGTAGESWQEFADFIETMYDQAELGVPIDPDQKRAWYKTLFEEAQQGDAPTDLTAWVAELQKDDHTGLMAALRAVWTEVLIGEKREQPVYVDEDSLAEWNDARNRAAELKTMIAEPIIAAAASVKASGTYLHPQSRASIMGIIRRNPEDYAAIFGEILGDEKVRALGAEAVAKKYAAIKADKRNTAVMSTSQKAALAEQVRNEKIASELRNGTLVVDDRVKEYIAKLEKDVKSGKKAAEKLAQEIAANEADMDAQSAKLARTRQQSHDARKELNILLRRIKKHAADGETIPAVLESQRKRLEKTHARLQQELQDAGDWIALHDELTKQQATNDAVAAELEKRRSAGEPAPKLLEKLSDGRRKAQALTAKLKEAKGYQNNAQLQTHLARIDALTKERTKTQLRAAELRALKKLRTYREKLARQITKPAGQTVNVAYAKLIRQIQETINPESLGTRSMEKIELLRAELEHNPALATEVGKKWANRALRKNLNEMTLVEMEETARRIQDLRSMGRTVQKQIERDRAADIDRARSTITDALMKNPDYQEPAGWQPEKTLLDRLKGKMRTLDYGFLSMMRFAVMLDGGTEGFNHELLVKEQNRHYASEQRAIRERTDAILQALADRNIDDWHTTKVEFPGAGPGGQTVTLSKADCLALEMAFRNEDSRQAALFGDFFSEKEKQSMSDEELLFEGESRFTAIRATLDAVLTEDDLSVLDVFAKDAAAASPRLAEIVASVENRELISVDNYFPMIRQLGSDIPLDQQVAADVLERTAGTRKPPRNGFTKTRVTVPPRGQRPIKLDLLSTWLEAIARQEHYIAFAEYGKRLDSYYLSPFVQEQIRAVFGDEGSVYVKEYLAEVKNPGDLRNRNHWENAIRYLRGNLGAAYLSWRASSALKQVITSPWPALPYVGPRLFTEAMKCLASPMSYLADAEQLSEYLRNRTADIVLDAIKTAKAGTPASAALLKAQQIGVKGLEYADRYSVAIGWRAMYEKHLAETNNHERAVQEADLMIQKTQPSSRGVDLAPMYRNASESARIFLQFTQAMNVIWQNMRFDIPNALKNHNYGTAIGIFTSYAIAGVLLNAVTEGFTAGDDEKKKAQKLTFWALTQGTESIPLIGSELTRVVNRGITGEKSATMGDTIFPAVAEIAEGMYHLSGGDIERATEKLFRGGGMALGAPVSGIREIKRVITGDPSALLARPKGGRQ